MAGNQDKIQLPTNSTDIITLVRYLKKIKEKEPLNNNSAQAIFQEVKTTGRRRKASGKRDTHTAGTLNTYGLIDYLPGKAKLFKVSDLGKELISLYNDEGQPLVSEEKQTVMLLKVFAAWHETKMGRDIHPGLIILKLLCDKDMDYYITEHDVAYFTSNPDFKTDDQYEEIKQYILDFRTNYDGVYIYCTSVKPLNLHDYVKIHAKTGGMVDEWSGKIVAEFICDQFKVIPFDRNHNSDITRIQTEGSCLTAEQVMDYLKQGSMYGVTGFGWHISNLCVYERPKPLSDFKRWCGAGKWATLERMKRPPQSWCYVD